MAKVSVFESDLHRIIIFGSNGKLGNYFSRFLRLNAYLETRIFEMNLDSNSSDFEILKSLSSLPDSDLLINCIGLVGVEICDRNPQLANVVNVRFPKALSLLSLENRVKLVHISTPSVFSGKSAPYFEADDPDSVSIYGKTKAAGEEIVVCIVPNSIVARVNFIGASKSLDNVGTKFISSALNNIPVSAFTDSYFSPTNVDLIIEEILNLGLTEKSGIFHLNSPTCISKYDFAVQIYREFNLDENMVKPMKFDHRAYQFSPNTTMKSKKFPLEKFYLPTTDLIQKLIDEYLNSLRVGKSN